MKKTFRELADDNRRNSTCLILLMGGICVALGGVGALIFAGNAALPHGLFIGGIVALILAAIGWNSGGSTLLGFHNALEIEKADAPQLFNVVEEMAIAAGLPMPRIFIIDSDAPNAFATGTAPENAAVAITTGLLEKLNREELQGVMAHELAHIRNFDIRFSTLMATMAGGIVILSEIILRGGLLFGGGNRRSSRDSDNGLQAVFLLIGIVLAILSPIITALVQMAMSRQREYLADASAVEFTRNPEGLASALERLAGDTTPMKYSKVAESMFIVSPAVNLKLGADGLFSTHPPIEERVKRLRDLNR